MAAKNKTLGFGTFVILFFVGAWITSGIWGSEDSDASKHSQELDKNPKAQEFEETLNAQASDKARTTRDDRDDRELDTAGHAIEQLADRTLGELSQHYMQMLSGDVSEADWRSKFSVYMSCCTAIQPKDLYMPWTEGQCSRLAMTNMVMKGVPVTQRLAIALGLEEIPKRFLSPDYRSNRMHLDYWEEGFFERGD